MKTKPKRKVNVTKLSKKERKTLLHLLGCGSALSNIVFNLGQVEETKQWHSTLKKWQLEWDNARNEASKVIYKLYK